MSDEITAPTDGSVELRHLHPDVQELVDDLKTRVILLEGRIGFLEDYIREMEDQKERASQTPEELARRSTRHL